MRVKNENYRTILLIALIGGLLFIPYLGFVHLFDWDEINFAEISREMIVTGDYLTARIDYQPFHEKPPLFFWLQVIAMHIFGINEFSARFPNAIMGIFTLIMLFLVGKKVFDYRLGLLWVLSYIGSILPFLYFKSGIIDPTFNFFIFLSIYYLFKANFGVIEGTIEHKQVRKYIVLAGVIILLANLTKGPVGYMLAVLTWFFFWFLHRKSQKFAMNYFILYSLIGLVPFLAWYVLIFSKSGTNIFNEFIAYQVRLLTTGDAGHSGPIYYHFLVLLFGCFPASILTLRAFLKRGVDTEIQNNFKKLMIILLCVVLGVFSIVSTKIVHYSSLAYFPVTFLSAYTMYSIVYRELEWKVSTSYLIGVFGILIGLIFVAFPIVLMNIETILPSIQDEFTKLMLMKDVDWSGFEVVPGFLFLIAVIVAIILWQKERFLQGFIILFASTTIAMFLILPLLLPKIEAYTQGTAIQVYKSLEGKDCYIHILDIGNYKYGHLFYSQKPPYLSAYYNKNIPKRDYHNWLLKGDIDYPVYFIGKGNKVKEYLENPELVLIQNKNGIAVLKREVRHKSQ